MEHLFTTITILEFIISLIILCKIFGISAKNFKLINVFYLAIFLWVMFELSKIEVAFGLDALDIIFILVLFIFIVWASKPFMEQDLLIREADKIIEKLNDKNYNPTEEELNRQMGFLSEQEKQDIKKQYIFDNIKILFGIIEAIVVILIISCLICLLFFGKIESNQLQSTISIVAFIAIYISLIVLTIKSLHHKDAEIRNAVKKDLPSIIAALTIGLIAACVIWYVFIGIYL